MEFEVEAERAGIAPPGEAERANAREALAALAHPRASGSDGAVEVAQELRRRFEELGYAITELPFTYSALPGRYGLTAAGVVFLLGTGAALPLLWLGYPLIAAAALVATLLIIAIAARYARRAVSGMRWGRRSSENWLVHRPGSHPRYLLAAHRDSKSQPVSTLWRTVAIGGALASWLALLVLCVLVQVEAELHPVIPLFVVGWFALVSGVLLLLARTGNESPGALDNATGLAVLLGVAERERDREDVAFVVTDAEELMLAGAAAVARQIPPVEGIVNVDIIDDEGDFQVVERFGLPRRGMAPHLVAALMSAADSLELPARRRDLPMGVMVDHTEFADAGLPAVTLHRGTLRTFRRVHRPSDDMRGLNGSGVAAAVALVSGALNLLRGSIPAR